MRLLVNEGKAFMMVSYCPRWVSDQVNVVWKANIVWRVKIIWQRISFNLTSEYSATGETGRCWKYSIYISSFETLSHRRYRLGAGGAKISLSK